MLPVRRYSLDRNKSPGSKLGLPHSSLPSNSILRSNERLRDSKMQNLDNRCCQWHRTPGGVLEWLGMDEALVEDASGRMQHPWCLCVAEAAI